MKSPPTSKGILPGTSRYLINLMANAPKFTETGEISLSINIAEQNEDAVLVLAAVRDTGIGIDEDKRSIIFRAFSSGGRVHDPKIRRYGTRSFHIEEACTPDERRHMGRE
jgi:hypothetical protein